MGQGYLESTLYCGVTVSCYLFVLFTHAIDSLQLSGERADGSAIGKPGSSGSRRYMNECLLGFH